MSMSTHAEQARTSVAEARVATLTTYPRLGRPVMTTVTAHDEDGAPVLTVDGRSVAAGHLRLRPLGTVRVSPPDWDTVTLQGKLRPLAAEDAEMPRLRFRLEVGSVRVGRTQLQAVPLADYWSAEPDPLRRDSAAILAHLRQGHGEQLAACLRAQGLTTARWADPRRLDRHGLELAVLEDDGVSTARLDFAAPVRRLADLSPGLSVVLQSACGRCGDCSTEPR